LRVIKKESPDTEVIMITGHGDMELAIQSLQYDATDFITKPINNDALEIALKRAREKIGLKTELKKYTEDLEQLVEEKTRKLLEAERLAAIGHTVAGLAHAIKNITGGLTGGAFVVDKGIELGNEKYLHQGWGIVKRNLDRIKAMAMDLLDYSRQREVDYALCDPNKPLKEAVDLMLPQARINNILLEVDMDSSIPQVGMDPERIHRCLLNLLTNSIDACTDISCTQRPCRIKISSKKADNRAVEYEVADNGCGMDNETESRIFRSFFSSKGSRGTGLGLMITKKIIEEHGGTIEVESERGTGTKVIIRLPYKAESLHLDH